MAENVSERWLGGREGGVMQRMLIVYASGRRNLLHRRFVRDPLRRGYNISRNSQSLGMVEEKVRAKGRGWSKMIMVKAVSSRIEDQWQASLVLVSGSNENFSHFCLLREISVFLLSIALRYEDGEIFTIILGEVHFSCSFHSHFKKVRKNRPIISRCISRKKFFRPFSRDPVHFISLFLLRILLHISKTKGPKNTTVSPAVISGASRRFMWKSYKRNNQYLHILC